MLRTQQPARQSVRPSGVPVFFPLRKSLNFYFFFFDRVTDYPKESRLLLLLLLLLLLAIGNCMGINFFPRSSFTLSLLSPPSRQSVVVFSFSSSFRCHNFPYSTFRARAQKVPKE
jgi:hypothetical protein